MRHQDAGLRISLPPFLRIFVCARNAIFLAVYSRSSPALSWPTRSPSVRQPDYPVGNFRPGIIPPKSYSATSNLIISIRGQQTPQTICQMFNCSNVRQYICSILAQDVSFVCVYKFTHCLRDTYTLFTLPTSNLGFQRIYGF